MADGELSPERQAALQELRRPEGSRRRQAAWILRRWSDPEVFQSLAQSLLDRDPDVRDMAGQSLLVSGDARALPFLVPLLRDGRPASRNAARSVLEKLGRAEPRALVELSRDPDPRLRIFSANIMGATGDHAFAPRLLEMLSDEDANAADAAIHALGAMRAPEAVDALAPLLSSDDPWRRFSAVDALARVGDAAAFDLLRRALPALEPELAEAVAEAALPVNPAPVDLLLGLLEASPPHRESALRGLLGPLFDLLPPGPALSPLLREAAAAARGGRLAPAAWLRALTLAAREEGPEALSLILASLAAPRQDVRERALERAVAARAPGLADVLRRLSVEGPGETAGWASDALARLPRS